MTGLTAYFIHPCRTADSLRASYTGNQVSLMGYLMLWFGVIGTSVGLALPMTVGLASEECVVDTDAAYSKNRRETKT